MNADEHDVFRDYVAARGGALLRSAVLLTGDRGQAEDLVQTALTRTYGAWSRIRRKEAVDAYVRRVMVTTYVNWWRRRWRGELPTGELPDRHGPQPVRAGAGQAARRRRPRTGQGEPMSEQELRDRLRAEVDGIGAPPGLADAVERGARRRRTGRLVVAGAAVAAVAVVGGVTLAPDGPSVPAAAQPADGCAELPAPAAVAPAPADTDMSGWGYRGDEAVRGDVAGPAVQRVGMRERVGPTTEEEVTAAFPVAGKEIPLSGTSPTRHSVVALAVRVASGWWLSVGEAVVTPAQPVGQAVQTLVPLPAPESGAVVSAYAQVTPAGDDPPGSGGFGAVVVLGAPGTERIDFVGCRDGRTIRAGADGDTLIQPVGRVEEAGRVTVRADGRVVSSGRVQDVTLIALPPAPEVAPPDGFRAVTGGGVRLLVEHRSETLDLGHRAQGGPLQLPRGLLLGTCVGRGTVTVGDAPLPCDGRTHTLRDGPIDLATLAFPVVGTPDRATGRTSLDVGLLVAEPER